MNPRSDAWAVFDIISDAVIVVDDRGRCRYANPAVETVLGLAPPSVIGRSVADVLGLPRTVDLRVRPESAAAEHRSDVVAWTNAAGRAISGRLRPCDGGTAFVLRSESGLSPMARCSDVSSETRFLHAQRLEILGRMASGIAHDFNNLLTVVRTYAELVIPELPRASVARDDMDEVIHAVGGAADLARQLLAFSVRQVPRPQWLDVTATVRRMAAMLHRVLGEDIRIETDLAPSDCVVLADAGQLEQVLMNLALNARDAMPNGGVLRFRTARVPIDAAAEGLGAGRRPGNQLAVVVEDTGVGIRPEIVGRIFDAFYTTKPEGQGTGLGLALVLSLVERMSGAISVESAAGQGSRFTVRLPCHDARDDQRALDTRSRMEEAPTPPGRGETILLIEDDLGVRSAVRRILVGLGYGVQDASTVEDAMRLAATFASGPALLVTDVVMPGESGHAVAEQLRRRWANMPVLFISGYASDDLRRRGIVVPAERLVEKPITPARLGHAVRRVLDDA